MAVSAMSALSAVSPWGSDRVMKALCAGNVGSVGSVVIEGYDSICNGVRIGMGVSEGYKDCIDYVGIVSSSAWGSVRATKAVPAMSARDQ